MGNISFIHEKAAAELEGLVLTKAWEAPKSGGFQLEVGIYMFLWGIGAKGVPSEVWLELALPGEVVANDAWLA
jgi:hypothetical protein